MDDEVKIPVKFQVDTSDLSKLKSEVDKVIESANRASKRRGKNALSIVDKDTVQNNIANLTILEGEIAKVQQKISELSKTSIKTDFTKAIKDVEYFRKLADKGIKDEADALRELKNARKTNSSAKKNEEIRVPQKIADIQAKAKADNRELTAQEKQKIALLKTEATLRSKLAANRLSQAKSSYDSAKEAVESDKANLSAAEQRRAELSDILRSEQKSEEYNERINQRVQKLNGTLKQTAELYSKIAQNTDKIANGTPDGTSNSSRASSSASLTKLITQNYNEQIKALNREKAAIQQSTARFYYKLRAVKMLGYQIKALDSALNKFGKTALNASKTALSGFLKLTNPVALIAGNLKKATSAMKKFSQATKSAKKSHDGLGTSLKGAVMTLLKYTLGIRSLYVLFNKLRNAMVSGMENLAQAFDPVNQKMSSIVTSLLQMKNAVATAVEPMLSVLAPALEKIAALVADIAYKIASFIAALTGRSFVYRATRAQVDYAKSLESTASAAKDVNKQLMAFDELNVINTNKDSGNGMPDVGSMFEEVPIDGIMADWANKFKEFLDKLFSPIKKAWEKMKDFVIKSWKYALNEMKLLADAVMEDFWAVWGEYATQKVFENIFKIVGDIGLIVGNITHNLRIAWKENKNGYRILASIRDIILVITNHLVDLFDYMTDWSTELSFIAVFNALADVLEKQVVPAVDKLMDLLVVLFEDIVLESLRYIIEDLIPKLLRAFGNIVEAIGNLAENFKSAWEEAGKGQAIVEKLEEIISYIADAIYDCTEATKEFAAELNFNPLLESIRDNLDKLERPIKAITDGFKYFYEKVLLPFWKYIVEDGLPKLLNKLGEISNKIDWDALTEKVNRFLDAFEPFLEKVWETLVIILGDLGTAIANFVNSKEFDHIVDKLIEWMDNADPNEMAKGVESLVEAFIGFKAFTGFASAVTSVLTGIMTFGNVISQTAMTAKLNEISVAVNNLSGTTSALASGGFLTTVGQHISRFYALLSNPTGETALANFGVNISNAVSSIEGIAKPIAGVVSIIVGSITAISNFGSMLADGFNLGKEAAMLLGVALTALGAILLGAPVLVTGIVAAIVAAVATLVTFLGTYGSAIQEWWDGLVENAGEWFNNLGEKLGELAGEAILKMIDAFKNFPTEFKAWISEVDWLDLGKNLIDGILFIFTLPYKIAELIWSAISNFFLGFVEGLCKAFGIHSPAEEMKPYGKYIILGILEGILDVVKNIADWVDTNIWQPFKSAMLAILNPESLVETGKNVMTGFWNGISSKWSEFTDWWQNTALANWWNNNIAPWFTSEKWQEVTKGIKEGISATWNKTVGYWVESLTSWWNDNVTPWFTTEKWKTLLNNVSTAFTSTFDSIVTSVTSKFDKIISSAQNMASKISGIVSSIKNKLSEIGSTVSSAASSAGSWISSKVSSLNISIPHLAQGAVIPPNKEFMAVLGDQKRGTNIETPLATMIEAFNAARGDEEILLREQNEILMAILEKEFSISTKDVFKAVKTENNNYIRRTGKSAFVY